MTQLLRAAFLKLLPGTVLVGSLPLSASCYIALNFVPCSDNKHACCINPCACDKLVTTYKAQRQQAWRGSQGSSYTTMLFCHVWYVTPNCLSCGVGSSSCSVTTGLFNLHSGYRQSQDQSSDDVGLCFCFRNVLGSISQTFNCWNRLPKEGNCISQSSLEEQNL